jgi:uncharacterized protein involved in exopolysaccharide biosynthesis
MVDHEHRTEPLANEGMGAAASGLNDEISVVEIVNVILRQRLIFVRVFFVIAGISLFVAITRPTRYTSSASFLPESSEPSASGALALAQQFGASIGGAAGERTPQFYADLVTSSEILRRTVVRHYPIINTVGERRQIDLIEYYEVDEETEEGRIERTVERLIDDVMVGVNPNTGIVNFSVTTSDPLLSHGMAAHILDLVNDFDLNTRQSQAGAERLFAGERVAQLSGELRQAEDSLQGFLVENRVFSNSPTLQFEHDRLQRAVAMRQELVTSLAQTFEQARIEEVRNTPVITLIEPPRVPALRAPKRRVVIMIIGVICGAVGGAVAVFVRSYMGQPGGTRPSDFQELSSLWSDTMTDLRRFLPRPFKRSAG